MTKESPQRVVITGGTEGIGKGIANNFLKAGAKVLITSRSAEKGEKAVSELKIDNSSNSNNIHFIVGDVSIKESLDAVLIAAKDKLGGVDVLVVNAGIYPQTRVLDLGLTEWNKVIDTNLTGTFLSVQTFLPELKKSSTESGGARIVLISSITGPTTGYPGWSHYGASKAGQLGFMKTVALELARDKITINAVLPGNIVNDSLLGLGDEYVQGMKSAVPLDRLGHVDDVAAAVLFFASPQASFITGQTLTVDGGQTLPESAQALEEI
jgi:3-oxoacyl-[acyl-carrier protein] reductase